MKYGYVHLRGGDNMGRLADMARWMPMTLFPIALHCMRGRAQDDERIIVCLWFINDDDRRSLPALIN